MSSENQKHSHEGMASRGATRPMAEQHMQQGGHERTGKEEHHEHHGHHKMDDKQRDQMLHMHHKQTLWIYWLLVILGIWMILSPLTFSYGTGTVEPAGGRDVWLPLDARVTAMMWSDIISGILLVFFGWRTLTPNRPVSLWICCFIGVWLNLAPIVFWSPSAAAYINGTIVGVIVIALTILIPGMPNMIKYMKMGSEVPTGWSYNPSSWPQRWILAILGFAGWVVSRYLGAYQLGYIDAAWDPFFGGSTMQVLTSDMSRSLPISDGAFGAFAYTLEFLMAWMGSPSRWRTMPWMVTLFGILVIPLGLVHIFLVISQPVVVGAWCTLCLLAAAIMLPMIPLEVDEVIAMGQHMVKAKRKGNSLWKVFWKGGEPDEHNSDERSPELIEFPQNPRKLYMASIWGMSFPVTLTISALLGVWLMFAPAAFGISIEALAADINHLTGALIVVVSVICMGEPFRRGRYLNILLGLIIAIGPWLVPDGTQFLNLNGSIVGMFVLLLSIPRGPVKEQFGLWDKYVS